MVCLVEVGGWVGGMFVVEFWDTKCRTMHCNAEQHETRQEKSCGGDMDE